MLFDNSDPQAQSRNLFAKIEDISKGKSYPRIGAQDENFSTICGFAGSRNIFQFRRLVAQGNYVL